jgi:hypothetical protein
MNNPKSVQWDTISYDNTNSVQANTAFPVVPISGMYLVTGTFSWNASADGSRQIVLSHNGYIAAQQIVDAAATQPTVQTIAMIQRWVAGETVAMFVYQDSSTTLSSVQDGKLDHIDGSVARAMMGMPHLAA